MVSAEEMLMWTGLTIPDTSLFVYSQAAEAQFKADGGNFAEPTRTQAICYLIASYIVATKKEDEYSGETIGGYSYAKKTSDGISLWMDRYRALLSSVSGFASSQEDVSGKAVRKDQIVLRMGGGFGLL